jgi:predicted AlkP superfamily phosphohydrolase/phosphomutase
MTLHLAYIDPGSLYTVSTGLAAVVGFALSALAVVALFFRRLGAFVKRHWVAVTVGAAVAVGAAIAVVAVAGRGRGNGSAMANEPGKRLIIIGLDGLSPRIIEPMMAKGELPNFKRLAELGGYSHLGTTTPAESPVAWTAFATGRNPGKTGVYDFIRRAPGSYLPDLSLTRLEGNKSLPVRKTKAFWQYGREAGVPMTILDCPVTFPPDEIDGKMLSGMGVPDLLGTQGTFSFYTTAPETVTHDTGGEVHAVPDANPLQLELLGPQKQGITGKVERLSAPFELRISPDRTTATVVLQGQESTLRVGEWSPWLGVSFKVGPFTRMYGILRFNLVELKPFVKLYAAPISIDPRRPWFQISFPEGYSKELAHDLGLFATRGMPFDTWALNEGRISEDAFIEHATDLYQERLRLMEYGLARCERGVFYCYFEYPDIIQHMYWRFIDPGHPLYDPNAPARLKGMIDDCYRKMDAVVGVALAAMRTGDTLIVLSDHGFTTFRRAAHIDSWLRENGYLVLKDPTATAGGPLFEGVDWSATRAYALGYGGIYINTVGREPQGTVPEGPEKEALKNEIAAKLRKWIDPKTGTPVARTVYLNQEIFHGAEAHLAPDVYIGFADGYGASWQTALGASPAGPLVEDNLKKWSGNHLVDPPLVPGILFTSRPIKVANPTLYDVAPTVLEFLGFDDARLAQEDLDGKPLF